MRRGSEGRTNREAIEAHEAMKMEENRAFNGGLMTSDRRLAPRGKSGICSPRSAIKSGILLILLAACGCHGPGQRAAPIAAPYQPQPGTPEAQAERIVVEGLNDPDSHIRTMAIEVVSATRWIRLMPKVQSLLSDRAVPVRFFAAVAIGDLRYDPAANAVSSLLNDADANVKTAAGYAMMKLGHAEYFRLFRDAITSPDQTVRANAALLLGKSGNQEARKLLYWTLQRSDSDEKVISQALESIAMLGDERIYPKLWTRLISAYADDRVAGIRAMGMLGTAQAKNALVTMLDDPVLEVRLAAAETLGKLGDAVGEAEVQQVFDKNSLAGMDVQSQERVKLLVAAAIGEIGTPSLTGRLPTLLGDPSQAVRLTAAKAVLRAARAKR
jgi:HEAT repeat protein